MSRPALFLPAHAPRTPETLGMMNADAFAACKPGARLINASRGGIVDEDALLAALNTGTLDRAALDVLSTEPKIPLPLAGHRRTMLTPHIGGSTHEARTAIELETVQNIVSYLTQNRIVNGINAHYLPSDSFDALRPERQLAEYLAA